MSGVKNTKLRFLAAKSPEEVVGAVESLPFKIEIKGAPVRFQGFWYLWFTIADNEKFTSVKLGV